MKQLINSTEVIMKKYRMAMTAMMVGMFFTGAAAQNHAKTLEAKMDEGKKNYTAALRSTNHGLIESAMMEAAIFKIVYPGSDITEMKDVIDSLAVNGTTPSIRYKARLASNVCDNPAWFAKNDYRHYDDNDEFFVAVAAQLEDGILGSRTN